MQFLTYEQKKYIVLARATPGNCGYVDIFKKTPNGSYEHYWSLMPEPGYPIISLAQAINDKKLYIVNKTGEFRLYNLKEKKEIASAKIGASSLFGAGIYPSQSKGYIVTKNLESNGIDIFEICLDSLKASFVQTIRGVFQIDHITVLDENQLAGYIPIGSVEGLKSSDGFLIINTQEQTHKLNYLRPSPSGLFPKPPVAFDPRTKTGIRPSYDPIEIIESDTDKKYLAKVLLFDLNSGKRIDTIVVREFTASEMFEDDDPKFALSCLELPTYSDDYRDIKEEFLERFEALQYCHLEDAFWVTFQHGFLRKVYLDGKRLSPLIAHPGDSILADRPTLSHTNFDTPLRLSPDDRFLAFGQPEICFATKILVNAPPDNVFLITGEQVVESGCETSSLNTETFSWINLDLTGSSKRSSDLDFLDLLLKKTKDLENLKDGPFLRFQFVTSKRTVKEEEFVQSLSWNNEQIDTAGEIISLYNSKGQGLWYDDSTPSFFYLLRRLVLESTDALGLFIEYLRLYGDCKEDSDRLAELVDDIINKMGWCRESVDMILTRAYFQPERGLEQLEYYLKQPDFELYLGKFDNRNYFRNHTLYKTLVEDYFSLFFPNEDQLFSAIEAEDNGKVESLLRLPLELNEIHPEYKLNPLDTAIETGNQQIISLLREAGAKSLNFGTERKSGENGTTIDQDISVDKAMRTLLSNLHRQQETIQKEIYDIQFSHMLNFSLSEEQSALLESKNKELKDIQSQIKYANLGLISLEDISESDEFTDISLDHQQNLSEGADSFDSSKSHVYADPASTVIEIEDLKENSQVSAFKKMKSLLHDSESIIFNRILRFNYRVAKNFISEKLFFEKIQLTTDSARVLSDLIRSLSGSVRQPVWYEDEFPAMFFALQKLVMYHERYLKDLDLYLKSDIIGKEEPVCVTEFIFDVYEHYGWNLITLSLAVSRLSQESNRNGLAEFRIQWKKGGLESYIRQPEIKEEFIRLLDMYCGEDRIEWFYQFIKKGE